MTDGSKVLRGALLIAGTTIGAGMLGLPLVTAQAGFFPALFVTLLVWGLMLITGLLFMEATLWCKDGANVLTISETYLGFPGKIICGALFVFLYYSLMIAYFAAGGAIFHEFLGIIFPRSLPYRETLSIFTIVFSLIVFIGPKSIDRANVLLSMCMVAFWVVLVSIGVPSIEMEYLGRSNWTMAPLALPVFFSAFGFHNIIPSLSTYLKRDRKALKKAIVIGTTIPLGVYIVWQLLILGVVDEGVLLECVHSGLPVTYALGKASGSTLVAPLAQVFSFFAIVTSVLGVSFSLVDFLGDGLSMKRVGAHRLLLTLMVFVPPFVFSYAIPNIFTMALGIAGGFGEAILNGILPVALVFVGRYIKKEEPITKGIGSFHMLSILFFLSLLVFAIEAYLLSIHA